MYIWVNIGSGIGLMPDSTKPLPEPILIFHQWCPVAPILQEVPQMRICKMSLKNTLLKLLAHISQANELTHWGLVTHTCICIYGLSFVDCIFNGFSWLEIHCTFIKISLFFLSFTVPIDNNSTLLQLTHWGWVTHLCDSKLTIIGSDNGLSPERRQAIIWTNAGLLLIGPLGTNFSEILIKILTFSFKKMRLKVSSAKRRPFCLGLNVLMAWCTTEPESVMIQFINTPIRYQASIS